MTGSGRSTAPAPALPAIPASNGPLVDEHTGASGRSGAGDSPERCCGATGSGLRTNSRRGGCRVSSRRARRPAGRPRHCRWTSPMARFAGARGPARGSRPPCEASVALLPCPDAVIATRGPDDPDGTGSRGRVNWIIEADGERRAGRFGWKASAATLRRPDRNGVPPRPGPVDARPPRTRGRLHRRASRLSCGSARSPQRTRNHRPRSCRGSWAISPPFPADGPTVDRRGPPVRRCRLLGLPPALASGAGRAGPSPSPICSCTTWAGSRRRCDRTGDRRDRVAHGAAVGLVADACERRRAAA